MEVHLEEASFLWTQWEQSLWALDYQVAELEQGEERRLLAHLDALVLGGRPVAERLLFPALAGDDAGGTRAATFALSGAEDADWQDAIRELLVEGDTGVVSSVRRAVELCPRLDLNPMLLRWATTVPPHRQAEVLAALRSRQVDVSPVLGALAVRDELPVLAEVVRAACFTPRSVSEGLVRQGLADPDPHVLAAALEAGLVVKGRDAWSRARKLVEAGGDVPRSALLALALGGDSRELEALLSTMNEPALREEALWALGFNGRLAAADAAFEALQSSGDRLAAESFAAITGLPLDAPFLEMEQSEDDEAFEQELLDAEEPAARESDTADTPAPASLLPGPVALQGEVLVARVEAWWAEARKRFDPAVRYLRGIPMTAESLPAALAQEPLRRRAVLLWDLAIRSQGAYQVESRTWLHAQRQQAEATPLPRTDLLQRTYSKLFGG
ncbi:TIGR02270 family protein [Myxococcus stipitatus]|uniref:TIGR02270 family protein n=1 Tax=Myxococcus stipitatus TaxID=83455 RepID=UPI0031451163